MFKLLTFSSSSLILLGFFWDISFLHTKFFPQKFMMSVVFLSSFQCCMNQTVWDRLLVYFDLYVKSYMKNIFACAAWAIKIEFLSAPSRPRPPLAQYFTQYLSVVLCSQLMSLLSLFCCCRLYAIVIVVVLSHCLMLLLLNK